MMAREGARMRPRDGVDDEAAPGLFALAIDPAHPTDAGGAAIDVDAWGDF
jgi:hypothetical protein